MVVLAGLSAARPAQTSIRTSMATSGSGRRARFVGHHIRIHHPRHERLVGRRNCSGRFDADERLNRFGEEHARTRARERARDDQHGAVEPLWCNGRRGEEPVVEHHRGSGRPVASSRGARRAHAARAAGRGEAGKEDGCQEGCAEEGRHVVRSRGIGRSADARGRGARCSCPHLRAGRTRCCRAGHSRRNGCPGAGRGPGCHAVDHIVGARHIGPPGHIVGAGHLCAPGHIVGAGHLCAPGHIGAPGHLCAPGHIVGHVRPGHVCAGGSCLGHLG